MNYLLLRLHVLSCLSLAFVYQENGKWKDTDGSSLRKLLGEFEEEGITDVSLHGHNIERPSGDDDSGDLSFFLVNLLLSCVSAVMFSGFLISPKPQQAALSNSTFK